MPKIQRAVFDTNILISAYLWTGIPRKALEIIRSRRCALLSAMPAVEEFVRVLGYEKFGLRAEEITPFVDDLLSIARIVNPRESVEVVTRDPTDNLFLSIAVAGDCSVIVSGDRHLLDLQAYRTIRIITASEFVHAFLRG